MNARKPTSPAILSIAFAALVAASFAIRVTPQESAAPVPEPRKIAVTAKKFEFNPETIELARGERVELTLTSLDRKHGFKCKELNLEGEVEPEKPLVVSFTADKTGTFEFKCSNFCGLGHYRMKGKIVVR